MFFLLIAGDCWTYLFRWRLEENGWDVMNTGDRQKQARNLCWGRAKGPLFDDGGRDVA